MKHSNKKRVIAGSLVSALLLSLSTSCFADFQYTETSKITGGAASGAIKFVGVFSKDARQATQGSTSTISFKGNKMRREDGLGQIEIIDLDARKITQIDTKKKTYSEMTFDEMRARMEEARKKAVEQQAKHNKEQGNVKIVPKIAVTPGSSTRKILDYTAKEMKVRVDMEMTSDDPKAKGQTATMWVNSDTWIASVKGYDEVKRFYQRMAKELDWVPGAVFGANPQIAPAMVEYRKSAATLNGMPLFSLVSVGMAGQPGQAGAPQASNDDQKQSSGNPLTKGIGGLFGKKKNKDDAAQDDKSGSSKSAPSGTPGSLMDTTVEVTSISNNSVDASLFTVPEGYKHIEAKGAK
ncbi:MAG TPA: hypothetical protein VG759_25710 [Candidatus Angelobacter sp.]|jgi:hypothetical protein|nr:hypothetical protein [Candidatus Angelobacter sp.]